MLGIEIYKKVVLDQDKSFLGKEYTNNQQIFKVTGNWADTKGETNNINLLNLNSHNNVLSNCCPRDIRNFMAAEWKEVKYPLTFMEVINSGKEFYSEFHPNIILYVDTNNGLITHKKHYDRTLCFTQDIINGKWYIVDQIKVTILNERKIGQKILIGRDNTFLNGKPVPRGTLYGEIIKINEEDYFIKKTYQKDGKDCISQFSKGNFESYFVKETFMIKEDE